MTSSVLGRGGRGIRPAIRRVCLCGLLLPAGSILAGPLGPAVSRPEPDAVVLRLDSVEGLNSMALSGGAVTANTSQLSPAQVAALVRDHIKSSRAIGSPRPLGLAQGLLDDLPQAQWTPELYLLRATLRQRLHRFDAAQADLDRVLEAQPGNKQAWLTRYSIALARGELARAAEACSRLGELAPGLLADTCRFEVESYGEQPGQALAGLKQRIAQADNVNPIALDWAWVILAEMASRLDSPEAGRYWAFALRNNPGDLYRRAQFADWLLSQDQPEKALALTEGYENVDALAVLRAIAMTRLDHPQRDALVQNLTARFEEARWRGEFLHQWEYARFLLDVLGKTEAALDMAQANWTVQRAYRDRQLLIRAAQAARDEETLQSLGVHLEENTAQSS